MRWRWLSSALDPIVDLRMRLGEGTGAAVALPVLRAAVAALSSMATFASANVSDRSDLLAPIVIRSLATAFAFETVVPVPGADRTGRWAAAR